jgi:hypothetical protein
MCFQQRVPIDTFASRIGILKLFYFESKTLQRKKKERLALNFRLAVNMLQLIYALKSTTIDGFQRLPSPGFHLNVRYKSVGINFLVNIRFCICRKLISISKLITWKRCKHSGHFSRFRNIIGNFCNIKQKCYVIKDTFTNIFFNNHLLNC